MTVIQHAVKIVAIALLVGLLALINPLGLEGAWADEAAVAEAVINSTDEGSPLEGQARFTATDNGLMIQAIVVNAPPGKHGFHIHENSSCAEGGQAAGGHFNPDKVKHGYLPLDGFEKAHAGDLGNIEVDENGMGELSVTVPGLTLTRDHAIHHRAVILHEKEDDFGQPTGNAGGRIGCGVISLSE